MSGCLARWTQPARPSFGVGRCRIDERPVFFQAELALREMDAPSISNVSVCLRRLSLERVTRVSSGESPTVRTARSESSSDGVATWK